MKLELAKEQSERMWKNIEERIKAERAKHNESELISIAQCHESDDEANKAMGILRSVFDPSYIWCQGCDGLVIKKKNCCMSRRNDPTTMHISSEDF